MDSIISLGQKNTLAEYMVLSDTDNRPPMLDKDFLPPEWSKFMTNVKLVKDLYTTNFDQLHAYPEQHELHANEVRLLRDDPIAYLNKAMAFLTVVASSRFSSTNNQLRTSSNLRNHATIQDGRVIVQQVQGRQGQSYFGIRNATWYKDKAMLAEAQKARKILDEEELAFLANPRVPDGQAIQTIIQNNAAFQIEDLDTYDSDCDDISNAKSVQMANIMIQTLSQSSHEKMNDSKMDDMIKEMIVLKEQVDSLEQNLSKQIKEKECLLQTFTVFKSKSKEKEEKYMENEIDLEKKIKELDNILFKVGQSEKVLLCPNKAHFLWALLMGAFYKIDDEETLILEEDSRSKMSEKAKDPEVIAKRKKNFFLN
ncbi:hypothetical protein Tco_1393593 [Tanacetum coccineum]